jgi:hypothetical protein
MNGVSEAEMKYVKEKRKKVAQEEMKVFRHKKSC